MRQFLLVKQGSEMEDRFQTEELIFKNIIVSIELTEQLYQKYI